MDSNLNGWEGGGAWSEGSARRASRRRLGARRGRWKEEAFSILPVAEAGGMDCTTQLGRARPGLVAHRLLSRRGWGGEGGWGGDSAQEPAPSVAVL